MARPLRIEFPGAVYHVVSRGNARQDIFTDDRDRYAFLDIIGTTIENFKWLCYAYCLMGNHYHLVIETPEANLSRGMQNLNGAYTQAFHKKHDTVGHLLQGRFKAILVDKENYLMELSRYIVLNPVRAGLVKEPQNWPWSSYRATADLTSPPPWLQTRPLLDNFSPEKGQAQAQYREFVLDGIGRESPWREVKSQVLLGKENFIDSLKPALESKEKCLEIPREQRYVNRPSLAEVFGDWQSKMKRDEGIVKSFQDYGYSQQEIAAFLDVHYTTISRVLKRQRSKKRRPLPAAES